MNSGLQDAVKFQDIHTSFRSGGKFVEPFYTALKINMTYVKCSTDNAQKKVSVPELL